MGSETTAMGTLLTTLAEVVTKIFVDWIPQVVTAITGQPFILLTVGFLMAGGVIGILGRLLSRN